MEITTDGKKRLASLIEEREMPLAPLAAKIGVSQSTLWNFIYGSTKNFSKLHLLATELRMSLDWIMRGDAVLSVGMPGVRCEAGILAEPGRGQGAIPVLGQASGKSDAIRIDRHKKNGDTGRHPAQDGVHDSFAMHAVGNRMHPRYHAGEMVYVAGGKPLAQGQDCVVELVNGEGFLRQFVAMRGDAVVCRQLYPAKECKWARAEVRAVYAVVGRG